MKISWQEVINFIATKFKELRDSINNKVDKVTGKDLSSNDYTDEAKAKVDAIPANPKYTDTIPDLSPYITKEIMRIIVDSIKIEVSKKADKADLGDKVVGVTQSEYDKLVSDGKVEDGTLYFVFEG